MEKCIGVDERLDVIPKLALCEGVIEV